VRIANAPLSYGAFELTVGTYANVPGPDRLLDAIAAAGYEGTELGPPGYLGDGDAVRARLDRTGLELTGGWCPIRFSRPEHLEADLGGLMATLDLFESSGAYGARPVFGDGGSPERLANPGRGKDDPSLRLDDAGWRRFADGLARAEGLARARGFAPVFHAHTSTYVEAPAEIDRLLELSSIDLLVDTGHLLVGGSDPVQALRDWGPRVGYVHLKDARLAVVREVVAEGLGGVEAWRRGVFCELGTGDVDLDAFLDALRATGYDGWLCVEQDRIPRDDEPFFESAEAQVRNREWLRQRGL
jgi:inosose dehydratase